MPYTAATPLIGSPRGSADAIASWAIARGAARPDDVRAYLAWLYTLAPQVGINPDVAVAQWLVECSDRATGQVPGQSVPWVHGLNPAGIGVTDDSQWRVYDFVTGERAAAVHLAHLGLYAGADVPPEMIVQDPRWTAVMRAGYRGIAPTLDGLTNTWAKDARYASKIADQLDRLEAAGLLPANVEAPPMAYKAHTWPGLSNPVYLPDTLKVSVELIPSSVSGWTSGTSSNRHVTFTQHFTGNMRSSARGDYNWARNGGRASVPGSYQLIVDGGEVIVAQRFDEMAGHAANTTGNYTSYASEMAIGGAGGYEGAFQAAAHVAAAVIVSKGWQVDTSLLQHWNWLRANGERKNCPSIIRDKGDWSRFVATVTRNAAAIRGHLAGGESPAPTPVYATPAVIPELDNVSKSDGIAPSTVVASGTRWFWVGDRVRVTAATGRFQRASKDAVKVGPDLKVGEEFDLDWITEYESAVWGYTPYGTRIDMSAVERISDAKGGLAA